MEKKTIGSFIAILRRANGLTQKELADKLGISDKAVSRWERDETAPDISLLPALAEILGVTTDELLRGERSTESLASARNSEKSEKQIKTLLKNTRTKLYIRTLICILIAMGGLFAAMICNSVFYRMLLGFIVTCVFSATSVVLEMIFSYLSRNSINNEDIESDAIAETRKYIIKKETLVFYINAVVLAFCLPLVIAGENYAGVDISSWFVLGGIFALVAAGICALANIFVDIHAEKKGIYDVAKVNEKRRKRARIFGFPALSLCKVFVPIFIVILVAQIFCMSCFDTYYFMEKSGGTEWNDTEKFLEYIETPVKGSDFQTSYKGVGVSTIITEVAIPSDGDKEYQYPKTVLLDKNGDVMFEFEYRNKNVYQVISSDSEDGLPIITYTYDDYYAAISKAATIPAVATIIYIVMAGVFTALYIIKTVKTFKKENER